MSRATPSLDRLPTEILTRILKPLLQHTPEQVNSWNQFVTLDGDKSYAQVMYPTPKGDNAPQPQVLCVCKRLNEVGTDLLYANHLIFLGWACTYYYDEEAAQKQRDFLKKLTRPRDERHRLKGLCLIIWTPDFYQFGPRDTDGDWLDELFAGLALHQPCWEKINMGFLDMTAPAAYNTDRMRSARLLYGLGRLHAKNLPGFDGEFAWCMESSEHRYPLLLLHEYMGAYFDAWTPRAQAESQIPLRREELMGRGLQAAKSYDEEGLFAVMVEAVEHVETVFRQNLGDNSGEPENTLEAPKTALRQAEKNVPYQKAMRECQEQGRQLLSARDRKWRASYRPKRVDLPERPRE